MTPTSAAMALGVSWRGNGQVRDFVKQLLQEWSFTPEAMRGFVRAARMKVTAEALAVGDGDLALKGTNQIASDPEVGLNQPPATVINIDFQRVSHLTNFLDKDIEIPVIEVED